MHATVYLLDEYAQTYSTVHLTNEQYGENDSVRIRTQTVNSTLIALKLLPLSQYFHLLLYLQREATLLKRFSCPGTATCYS